MTLTAISAPYEQRFGPFAPDIYHAPYPYEYRGWTTDEEAGRAMRILAEAVEASVGGRRGANAASYA